MREAAGERCSKIIRAPLKRINSLSPQVAPAPGLKGGYYLG